MIVAAVRGPLNALALAIAQTPTRVILLSRWIRQHSSVTNLSLQPIRNYGYSLRHGYDTPVWCVVLNARGGEPTYVDFIMNETLDRTISSNGLENIYKRLCCELKRTIGELQNDGLYTIYEPMCRQIEQGGY